jgi:hypothetical protein
MMETTGSCKTLVTSQQITSNLMPLYAEESTAEQQREEEQKV